MKVGREIISLSDIVSKEDQDSGQTLRSDVVRSTSDAAQGIDGYKERLLKYIPVEIVGAFLAIDLVVRTAEAEGTSLHWFSFFVLAAVTPVFLNKILGVKKRSQMAISLGAFVVWVHALPGPFLNMGAVTPFDYSPLAAAIFLILYSTIAPLYEA